MASATWQRHRGAQLGELGGAQRLGAALREGATVQVGNGQQLGQDADRQRLGSNISRY